jgi:hypothetical protein
MQVEPNQKQEQDVPRPEDRLVGFVNTKAEKDAIVEALHEAGYPDSKIMVLFDKRGIEQLKQLHEKFFFSDPEYQVIEFGIKELQAGHYCLSVEVEDRDAAAAITDLATRLGGHGFQYIGLWVTERLSK